MNTLRTLLNDLRQATGKPVDLVARVDLVGNLALSAEWRVGGHSYRKHRTYPAEVVAMDPPAGSLEALLLHDVLRFVERAA